VLLQSLDVFHRCRAEEAGVLAAELRRAEVANAQVAGIRLDPDC
jgi:hypothetical protein